MKQHLLAALLCCLPAMLPAQIDSFNLADYRLPDIKTHRLDFSLSGNGATSNQKSFKGAVPGLPNSDYHGNGTFDARYTMQRNSERYQGLQSVSLSVGPGFTKDPGERNASLDGDFRLNSENRLYYGRYRFILIKAHVQSTEYLQKNEDNSGQVLRQRNSYLSAETELMAGRGRIEPVQDARLAVYILDDLQKAGRLSGQANQAEVLEFARLISKTRSRRFFDARDKLIWELETLGNWLDSTGLLAQEDAVAVTRIYDNWLYANGPVRESGRRVSAGLIPGYNRYGMLYNSNGDSFAIPGGDGSPWLKAVMRWEGERPVNLCRQTGYLVELSGWFYEGFSVGGSTAPLTVGSYWSAKGSRSWGWYPNSRTSIRLSLGLEGLFYPGNFGEDTKGEFAYGAVPDIGLKVSYYIAPQVRVSLNYTGAYSFSGARDPLPLFPFRSFTGSHRFDQTVALNVWYSLF